MGNMLPKLRKLAMITQLKTEFFRRDPCKNEVNAVVGEKKPVPVEEVREGGSGPS